MAEGSDSSIPSKVSRSHGGLRRGPTIALVVITEIIKWLVILAAVYLGAWQYCEITDPESGTVSEGNQTSTPSEEAVNGYAKCTLGEAKTVGQFWGAFTGIIVGISVGLYLPWRIVAVKLRFKYYVFRDERWRPAILIYIILGAIPAFALILAATQTTTVIFTKLEPETVTSLQMVIVGLVVTEWTTKVQQEVFTFDLLTAMTLDFFFAYEVIAFVMLATNHDVYTSVWIYPCFVFAVVSMFKYLPTIPVSFQEYGVSWGHVIHIVVSLLCNDIPFIIIRFSTMIQYHSFLISDMIFLMKNWSIIIFNSIQLGLIFYNRNKLPANAIPERRKFRGPEVWCDPNDSVCRVRVAAVGSGDSISSAAALAIG